MKLSRCAPLDFRFYLQGYHLLLRDLQAPEVWEDILDWINNENNRVPDLHDDGACK